MLFLEKLYILPRYLYNNEMMTASILRLTAYLTARYRIRAVVSFSRWAHQSCNELHKLSNKSDDSAKIFLLCLGQWRKILGFHIYFLGLNIKIPENIPHMSLRASQIAWKMLNKILKPWKYWRKVWRTRKQSLFDGKFWVHPVISRNTPSPSANDL